jgi:hypothetical protein
MQMPSIRPNGAKVRTLRGNDAQERGGAKMTGSVKARELLKHLQGTQKVDLPVVVLNDDQQENGYQPINQITVLHNGCLVLHVGSRPNLENKKM